MQAGGLWSDAAVVLWPRQLVARMRDDSVTACVVHVGCVRPAATYLRPVLYTAPSWHDVASPN